MTIDKSTGKIISINGWSLCDCGNFFRKSKLELFARTREGMFGNIEYEGWDVYGNEVDNSIELISK